jgi:hypothetical protein
MAEFITSKRIDGIKKGGCEEQNKQIRKKRIDDDT